MDLVFWVRIRLEGREYLGVLDTGAPISIVAKKILPCGNVKNVMPTAAIWMGDGHVVYSCGDSEVEVPMGSRSIPHRFYMIDTEAFDFVLGTDFFVQQAHILSVTLQAPYVLHVDHNDSRKSVPLEQSEHTSSYLRVCTKEPSTMMPVCQENHTRLKLEKCKFMQETMQYLGLDVGYGWWTPVASKAKPLMDAKVRHEDPTKVLHDVRSFIRACNFYRCHIKKFTYTSAILTDLIKKSTTWRSGPQEQHAFDKLKHKVANAKCLGVHRAQGEIILVTDTSKVGGGGTLFQWQALENEEFDSAISQWGTDGLNADGTLKHSYPADKRVLVPLGHWNWKGNQARGNYSTYEQELLAGMLVLSSQARLLGSSPVVWLCDQEPVRTFQKGPPPKKAKLRRWLTYVSQLQLTVHHIQGVKSECADYISSNNFDDMIGDRSEALAKEAFSRMDVHLDLNMTMRQAPYLLKQVEYLNKFGDIYKLLEKRLEPILVSQEQWKRDESYLWHEDRIVVPRDQVPALLKWTHESTGHVVVDRTLKLFKQWSHSTWSDDQLRRTLQPIMDKCLCRSCKPGDIRDRGLYPTLLIPHCANSVLYVEYTEIPKFGSYDFALVVTCGLTRFTRVFPSTKHIIGEETIKILLEEWFCVCAAPKEINSDEDVRVRSDTGWYKRVLSRVGISERLATERSFVCYA